MKSKTLPLLSQTKIIMKLKQILAISILLSASVATDATSQEKKQLPNPFDFPAFLSGNFGELRANHFHSGIDFKTQGAEGKPIKAVQDGYVSRISVSPTGYGNCLYIDHPDGTTTVYGHLKKFPAKVEKYIKEQQYAQESFSVNLFPEPDMFPIKKGETVAYSGNTGSSGGPHLHFEVRDTKTEDIMDPVPYFSNVIKDKTAPQIRGVRVYPVEGGGIVNNSSKKQNLKIISDAKTKGQKTEAIKVWGEIGFAIKCYDKMDGTSNIYGVRHISLSVDGEEIFNSDIDRFAFSETRYLNSLIDYADWKNNNSFYIKSFVDPGNKLRFLSARNRGIVNINEEKTYNFVYTLKDYFGNTTTLKIPVKGEKQDITAANTEGKELFIWSKDNRFGAKGVRLLIPKGNLYKSAYIKYSVRNDSTLMAPTHYLNDEPVALHKKAMLSLKINSNADTLKNKKQYGIVQWYKGKPRWVGGTYKNGWINGEIRELGAYTVRKDIKKPSIIPVGKETWTQKRKIVFRLTDDLSGVKSYRGEIDGKYVLFKMNNKSVITYTFDNERLKPGKHLLKLYVKDACGNESVYEYAFTNKSETITKVKKNR